MKNNCGKYLVGPSGMKCPCCIKLPKRELKVKLRRYHRHKNKKINIDIAE